jgi:hypothetical protein
MRKARYCARQRVLDLSHFSGKENQPGSIFRKQLKAIEILYPNCPENMPEAGPESAGREEKERVFPSSGKASKIASFSP